MRENEKREQTLSGTTLTHGEVNGPIKHLGAPLSFWGGYDAAKGIIIDKGHPCFGESLAGCVMVMTRAKGSSSSSSVLAEAIRNGTGPIGILLSERDLIIAIGAIVAGDLYGINVPVVALSDEDFHRISKATGDVTITAAAISPHQEEATPALVRWTV